MSKTKLSEQEKISKLIDYYQSKGLLLVGFNYSQGIDTTSTVFKKELLEYLSSILTNENLTPTVINAFSLIMNKTEHIDFLSHNISLEEIKLSQVYGAVSALEKVMKDVHLPNVLGKIGYTYNFVYKPREGDKDLKISFALQKAIKPVVIYSSGVNNLMRIVCSNPLAIKGAYKRRDTKPNYDYTQ